MPDDRTFGDPAKLMNHAVISYHPEFGDFMDYWVIRRRSLTYDQFLDVLMTAYTIGKES